MGASFFWELSRKVFEYKDTVRKSCVAGYLFLRLPPVPYNPIGYIFVRRRLRSNGAENLRSHTLPKKCGDSAYLSSCPSYARS